MANIQFTNLIPTEYLLVIQPESSIGQRKFPYCKSPCTPVADRLAITDLAKHHDIWPAEAESWQGSFLWIQVFLASVEAVYDSTPQTNRDLRDIAITLAVEAR